MRKSNNQVTKDNRFRLFATEVYPESAPENWKSIVQQTFIPTFISPCHDQDINENGTPKKPHYHIFFMFDGKKTVEQVRQYIALFNGVGCEIIANKRGYARYLCHLDNPEKAQYNPDDVIQYNGVDYEDVVGIVINKYKVIREMMIFCRSERITDYSELLEYAADHEVQWFRTLCDNGTFVMKEYLKSLDWRFRKENLGFNIPKCDLETGEMFPEDND